MMQKTQQTLPIIPWMGGKRRLAKHLLPMFPEHSCYVELFSGGAALFFMADVQALNAAIDFFSAAPSAKAEIQEAFADLGYTHASDTEPASSPTL